MTFAELCKAAREALPGYVSVTVSFDSHEYIEGGAKHYRQYMTWHVYQGSMGDVSGSTPEAALAEAGERWRQCFAGAGIGLDAVDADMMPATGEAV